MLVRALLLALTALVIAAPAANAAVADRFVPVYAQADGVNARMGKATVQVTFGPKAAKLYKTFAGHTVALGCGRQSVPVPVDENGASAVSGGSSFDTGTGRSELHGSGYLWTYKRFPSRRGRVDFGLTGDPYDVCFVATKARKADDDCLPVTDARFNDGLCVRMVVALTDAGRTMIDRREREIELEVIDGAVTLPLAKLQRYFPGDVVALDSPDASPPLGKVGVFNNGTATATVVLTADGHRLFIRQDGEVFSTNVSAFAGGRGSVFELT